MTDSNDAPFIARSGENLREAVSPSIFPVFVILLIGAVVHGTMILQAEPLKSANDRSRWCTVRSLLEQQTYRIDDVRNIKGWDTIDLVKDGDHYFSTKPPILATWIAGISWCLCHATGWTFKDHTQAITSLTLLIANGLPMFVSWLVLVRILRQTMHTAWGQSLVLVIAVFATLLTPFSVTLNNHSVAAVGAMLTIVSLWEILRTDRAHWVWFLVCGFSSAWTCTHELPAALLGIFTFLVACRKSFPKTILAYVPASVIPLAFFFATNWLATGGWKPAYADYGTEKYRFVVDGVPSYWMEPKGVDQNLDSPPVYLFHCLIGHHGLFSLTPLWLLLLIPTGSLFGKSFRRTSSESILPSEDSFRGLRTICVFSSILTLVVLAFYLTRTENYNYGGNSCGLRWAVWLTPFWVTSLIPIFNAFGNRFWFRWAMVPLFLVSGYSAWSRVDNPWQQPWIFTLMEARGMINFSEPRPKLPHPLWTWIAAVPDVSDGKPRWMELENASAAAGTCRLRIEAAPSAKGDSNVVLLTVTRRCGDLEKEDPGEQVCQVHVDRHQFEKGAKPAAFLRWPDLEVTSEKQLADLAFLRGMPLLKEYRPGVMRYRKIPLRKDAFRCQHVLVQVRDDSTHRNYRCEIWRCEELPFGIAEVEFQVLDANQQQLHQERWQAVASEPPPLPHAQWSPQP